MIKLRTYFTSSQLPYRDFDTLATQGKRTTVLHSYPNNRKTAYLMKLLPFAIIMFLVATTSYGKTEPLVFTKAHSKTSIEIIETLSNRHYKKQSKC